MPGIGRDELVFGVSYAGIVNAAFTHTHPLGSRFNGPDRGVWYAGFELETSQAEIAWHKSVELAEIDWFEESVTYDDYLADFGGDYHDLGRRRKLPAAWRLRAIELRKPCPSSFWKPAPTVSSIPRSGAPAGPVLPVSVPHWSATSAGRPAIVLAGQARRSRRSSWKKVSSRFGPAFLHLANAFFSRNSLLDGPGARE
ncbi:RES family NAD+ phosphorylase [Fodinicurvata fenggangensis]|uniref:RES family NAD+ phosphorylase n=1 Tax=Fodinicurvata fenggangensis TaxID=1121830 RepID=UPI001B805D54|nr:RES family NAD+ phosphorylase [Fodinicurvata fenggangensis]